MGIESEELTTWDAFGQLGEVLARLRHSSGVECPVVAERRHDSDRGHRASSPCQEGAPAGAATRCHTTRNERHHADKAWSQMLAYWGLSSTPKIDFSHLGCVGRRESALALEAY